MSESNEQPKSKAMHIEYSLADYHANPRLGNSMMNTAIGHDGSWPLFYGTHVAVPPLYPKKQSAAFDRGSVAHAALTAPGGIDDVVALIPDEVLNADGHRKGAAWKQWTKEHSGLIQLKADDYESIRHMVRNVYAHSYGAWLMGHAIHFEFTLFYECPETGISLKARPDLICGHRGRVILVDFKTTKALTLKQWRADCARYGYHRQAAWYWEALELYGYDVQAFLAVTANTSPAHECRVFQLPDHAIEQGRKENHENRRELARRLDQNDWTDPLGKDVLVVDLPQWAYDEKEGVAT